MFESIEFVVAIIWEIQPVTFLLEKDGKAF